MKVHGFHQLDEEERRSMCCRWCVVALRWMAERCGLLPYVVIDL